MKYKTKMIKSKWKDPRLYNLTEHRNLKSKILRKIRCWKKSREEKNQREATNKMYNS